MLLVRVVPFVSDSVVGVDGVGMLNECRELVERRCLRAGVVVEGFAIGEGVIDKEGVRVIPPVRKIKSAGSSPTLSSSCTWSSSDLRFDIDRWS